MKLQKNVVPPPPSLSKAQLTVTYLSWPKGSISKQAVAKANGNPSELNIGETHELNIDPPEIFGYMLIVTLSIAYYVSINTIPSKKEWTTTHTAIIARSPAYYVLIKHIPSTPPPHSSKSFLGLSLVLLDFF